MDGKRVLFSPVGNSDPINDNYDGPMLHIIRHYSPHTVVLFMSKEIAKYHHSDDRYVKAIKHVAPDTRVEIEESDIENAHDFDAFSESFSDIIKRIKEKFSDSEILVNVSSGTAQMQTALCILAAAGTVKIKPVQVSTHRERSNYGKPEYDIEKEIKNNLDDPVHEQPVKNRCIEPPIKNHIQAFAASQIRKFISEYDYNAALHVASERSGMFDKAFISMLEMASERMSFNLKRYSDMKKAFGDSCFPLPYNDYTKLLEYYLIMRILKKKGMIADYMIRLSPLGAEIGGKYLLNKYGFDLSSCLIDDRLDKSRIPAEVWEHIENKKFFEEPSFVCLKEVIDLIRAFAKQRGDGTAADVLNKLENMRIAEEKVRNLAAHHLKAITLELVRNKTGISIDTLDRQVRDSIVACSNGMIKNDNFNLYERMNKLLIEKIM